MNEKAHSIAHDYFVLGDTKQLIAKRYDVSVSYVSNRIKSIEDNLKRVLDLNGLEIVVHFQPKGADAR